MQTKLDSRIQQKPYASTVESILRKCVHCGFCNATCPTYQLRGDELDGPRGRIYQMKQFFEGAPANQEMLKHLDRCLTCRSCETTCPSGVDYSHLLEIGRDAIAQELPRSKTDQRQRWLILRYINSGWFFALTVKLAQAFAWLLPTRLKQTVPARQTRVSRSRGHHQRRVLMLAGCVQSTVTPNTNDCSINLLNKMGIETIELAAGQCCGAAALHTSEPDYGLQQCRRLIDDCWPHIEAGIEAIVITASGCGVTVKDYARLLADDLEYADKAATVSALYCDLLELVDKEREHLPATLPQYQRVAVHTPCSLQHGLGLNNRVEQILESAGYQICRVEEAHLCCGSAGTYSLLQAELSEQLRGNKVRALSVDQPEVIVTANVGCQLQLSQQREIPVKHWIELL